MDVRGLRPNTPAYSRSYPQQPLTSGPSAGSPWISTRLHLPLGAPRLPKSLVLAGQSLAAPG
jgi:hypothetical protein